MNDTQLSFLPRKTAAQIIYGMCWKHYMSQNPMFATWNKAIVTVSEQTGVSEALVARIVHIQSRWDARKMLRRVKAKNIRARKTK